AGVPASSPAPCTLAPGTCKGAVRLGLEYVKGVGEAAYAEIEAARWDSSPPPSAVRRPPFRNLRDFCQRTGLDRRSVERLIAVGAFDGLGSAAGGRRELLWELPAILEELRAGELPGLASSAVEIQGDSDQPLLEPPSAL